MSNLGKPIKVSNAKADDLQYTDKSLLALWDAKDQPTMDKLFHNKIRQLNQEFDKLRLKELKLYVRNMSSGRYKDIHDIPNMEYIWEQKAAIHNVRWTLIESLDQIVQRNWNDQTPLLPIQPMEEVCQEDLVTNYGMERIAAHTCNESNTYFRYVNVGSSLIPAGIGQTRLFSEKARVSVSEQGWMTAKGRLIRGGAEFPKSVQSFACSESAIMDKSSGGGAAWRTVYPANKIVSQVKDETYLTVSHTVDQGSVGL